MTKRDDTEPTAPHEASWHSTAVIEDGATLGAGTRVWHHAHVRAGASVGAGCTLGKNVYIDAGVRIGAGCKIQNNVSVYAGVLLEDEVFVGPSAVFTNDRVPRASSTDWTPVATTVRRGASIGANATLVAGVEIGSFAMVGAGAVVVHDVAAHELVVGNPAQRAGWVCACGQLLVRSTEGCPPIECAACGQHFAGTPG